MLNANGEKKNIVDIFILVLPQKGNRGANAGVRGARPLARPQVLQAFFFFKQKTAYEIAW